MFFFHSNRPTTIFFQTGKWQIFPYFKAV